ncbi:hypothetical protein P9302_00415 [Brevibacillus agri]|uniref:hypothetical protein n=1 Tax=Brevibacillus agri TaxID=51101 RepID=UPI002E1EA2E5|nr:hypothetical protein [Brevibacillus agri]
MSVNKHKEMEKLVTLMNDKEWVKTISALKEFEYDGNYNYKVVYREGTQRKNSSFIFHKLQFVEETNSFIFTSCMTDFKSGKISNEVRDKIVLKVVDIIKFEANKKPNYDFSIFG